MDGEGIADGCDLCSGSFNLGADFEGCWAIFFQHFSGGGIFEDGAAPGQYGDVGLDGGDDSAVFALLLFEEGFSGGRGAEEGEEFVHMI